MSKQSSYASLKSLPGSEREIPDINFQIPDVKKNIRKSMTVNPPAGQVVESNKQSMVVNIPSIAVREKLKNYDILCIDNYADWCGPCKSIAPLYEMLASKYTSNNCIFAKENVDIKELKEKDVAISGIPVFVIYNKGQVHKVVYGGGSTRISEIEDIICKLGAVKQN